MKEKTVFNALFEGYKNTFCGGARDDAPDIRSVALCSARSSSSLSDDEESKVLLSFTAAAELGMM